MQKVKCSTAIVYHSEQVLDIVKSPNYNKAKLANSNLQRKKETDMKRTTALILAFAMTFSVLLTGCSSSEAAVQDSPPADTPSQTAEQAMPSEEPASSAGSENGQSNVLVAYFSWAENAVLSGEVDAVSSPSVTAPGNVQQLAGWVQEETGADLFSIRVTDPYPSDWDSCLDRANQERGDDARPALVENIADLSQYDTVFLGYPNWWYGVPMALLTFLESNDFSGKQVYLFCSHGTGGLASSVEIITEAIPDAHISDNIFDCNEEDAASSQTDIQSWVSGLTV